MASTLLSNESIKGRTHIIKADTMKIPRVRRKRFDVETICSKGSNHRGTNTIVRMEEELSFGNAVPLSI
jgi:hypothetical protein